jgi:hypothetical protein
VIEHLPRSARQARCTDCKRKTNAPAIQPFKRWPSPPSPPAEQGRIRIVSPDIGGVFGHKGILLPEESLNGVSLVIELLRGRAMKTIRRLLRR